MSAWRERGFVPDSEDENESTLSSGEDEQKNDRNETQANVHSGYAQELRAKTKASQQADYIRDANASDFATSDPQDQKGLIRSSAHDELSDVDELSLDFCRPQRALHTNTLQIIEAGDHDTELAFADSDSSTTLSPPPSNLSSPTQSPIFQPISNPKIAYTRPPRKEVQVLIHKTVHESTLFGEIQQPLLLEAPLRAMRNFRQRKAIQLHPYLLEGERYRQTLKSRGIKPVHTGASVPPIRREETQDKESYSSSDSDKGVSNHESSSPVIGPSSTPPTLGSSPLNRKDLTDLENELPSISAILQRKEPGLLKKNSSRPSNINQKRILATTSADEGDVFEVPLSPVETRNAGIQDRSPPQKRLKILPKLSEKVRTSSALSTKPNHRRYLSSSESESDLPPASTLRKRPRKKSPQPRGQSPEASRHEIGDVASDSNANASTMIQQYKRRIKGVLPASWLRLDQQGQSWNSRTTKSPATKRRRLTKINSRLEQSKSPEKPVDSHSIEAPSFSPILVSDGSDGISNAEFAPRLLGDEVEEYDWVDTMSTNTKSRSKKPSKRKRQLRLEDQGVRRKSRTSEVRFEEENRRGRNRTGRKALSPMRKPARRSRPTKRSILDVDHADSDTRLPQFIRLAQRQARKQDNLGRQNPSNKYLRLQTEIDTADALETLHAWQNGKLPRAQQRQKRVVIAPSRRVLQPIHLNTERLPLSPPESRTVASPRSDSRVSNSSKRIGDIQNHLELDTPRSIPRAHKPLVHVGGSTKNGKAYGLARSGFVKQPVYRSAQLEGLEHQHNRSKGTSALKRQGTIQERNLHRDLNLFQHLKESTPVVNPQLEKFINEGVENTDLAGTALESTTEKPLDRPIDVGQSNERPPLVKRITKRTKRKPQRLDIQAREYRQPSDPLPVHLSPVEVEPVPICQASEGLEGLGAFAARYSTDFDILPLEMGTFFHESTFVGSGRMRDCLRLSARDLYAFNGHISLDLFGRQLRWGRWGEETLSDFVAITPHLSKLLEISIDMSSGTEIVRRFAETGRILEFLATYLARTLTFTDHVDRDACVARTTEIVQSTYQALLHVSSTVQSHPDYAGPTMHILTVLLSIASMARDISRGDLAPAAQAEASEQVVIAVCKMIVNTLLQRGLGELRAYLNENRYHVERERGIRSRHYFIEGMVVTSQICAKLQPDRPLFADLLADYWIRGIADNNHANHFDSLWYDLFTLLPFAEFDDEGLIRVGRRFSHPLEVWAVPRTLLSRLLQLYPSTANTTQANNYVRSVLIRCLNLIQMWGWRHGESSLGVMFDFFARNGLAPLNKEEYRGSPQFLDHLNVDVSLSASPDDRAFHVFLKTLACCLRALQGHVPAQKFYGIVYRFIPNHGRVYRKDMPIKQEDLNALRNHHDTLCVLYWSSPLGSRPKLDLLRELVDHTTSHREACRLNVRAWAILTRFQISNDEAYDALQPFGLWCRDLIAQTINLYRLARTEAESHFETAQQQGIPTVGVDILKRTIASNQVHVLATLSDIVAGLRSALKASNHMDKSFMLLQECGFAAILQLFDPNGPPRANQVIMEVLETLREYLATQKKDTSITNADTSDDSQDYGEFPDLDDPAEDPVDFVTEPLWHLLSNAFGADTVPHDAILTKSIDTWVCNIEYLVASQRKEWTMFLVTQSPMSWQQLRSTKQRRMYTTYFLASVIIRNSSAYRDHSSNIWSAWIVALVERESLLKFQHLLTAALLNTDSTNALFQNLPFGRSHDGRYKIELEEFRSRRLSLISTVLSNMRGVVDCLSGPALAEAQRIYSSLLKDMMAAMKANFNELNQTGSVTGSYVIFVHSVVEFLQQYAIDIQPIDRFFTDSSVFPLPASDPTYVVGRLKGYGVKGRQKKNLKQLAIFLQIVSERAAIEQQQQYLTTQILSAIAGSYESVIDTNPSLRHMLFMCFFPAYVEDSLQTWCGWIVAQPILTASARILNDLKYDFSITDPSSVRSTASLLDEWIVTLQRTVELVINQVGLLDEAHILRVLSLVYQNIASLLPTFDYFHRRVDRACQTFAYIRFFELLADFITAHLLGDPCAPEPMLQETARSPLNDTYVEAREFCKRELQDALKDKWSREGGEIFFRASGARKQIHTDLKSYAAEKLDLLNYIRTFESILARMPAFTTWERVKDHNESIASELVI